jgi:large subunit ribosomal protein L4
MADTTTFQAPAFTQRGTARDAVTLPAEQFDGTVHVPVMHQAVKAFLANQRQANAHTKIRKYVTGGNQKPWKQKGTGRARQGSTRAPHWVGGGTVFGPTNERNYKQDVPRQVRQLARKSALNARARENAVIVIDRFEMEAPRTKAIQALVGRLGLDGRKVLVLTDGVKPSVFLSARNLPTVHVMPYNDASTYHVLWSDTVLIEAGAIGQSLDPVTETESAPAPRKAAKTAAPKPAAKPAASRGEGKAAAKTAARKAAGAKKSDKKSAKKAAKAAKPATKTSATKKTASKAAAKKAAAKKSAAKPAPSAKRQGKSAPKKKER